jgi:hypothetical protein
MTYIQTSVPWVYGGLVLDAVLGVWAVLLVLLPLLESVMFLGSCCNVACENSVGVVLV